VGKNPVKFGAMSVFSKLFSGFFCLLIHCQRVCIDVFHVLIALTIMYKCQGIHNAWRVVILFVELTMILFTKCPLVTCVLTMFH